MKKNKKFTPQWLKDEPKIIASAYMLFSAKMRKVNSEDWESLKVTETARLIAAAWKNLEASKKAKTVEKFKKVIFELISLVFQNFELIGKSRKRASTCRVAQ